MNIEIQTKSNGKFTVEIDDEDIPKVAGKAIYVAYKPKRKKAYALICVNGKSVYLNRFLFPVENNEAIEFIDGNQLNNKKSNFRVVPWKNNGDCFHLVRTGNFSGVYASLDKKKFYAQIITADKKDVFGPFATEFEAQRAFDEAAK